MSKTLSKFDAAVTLRDSAAIAEYMAAAFETQDASYVSHALGVVARAKGMSEISRASGLSREHLYRSFSEDGNPTLKSILAVMDALGVQLSATAAEKTSATPTKKAAKRPAKKAAGKKAHAVSRKKSVPRSKKKAAA
ncbi:MAG: putative addiction module antidote protein [Haliea sp.]|jgi:probable addiction module antidote protein|nr:putative addiction module antidote protein [Haliea sp.]